MITKVIMPQMSLTMQFGTVTEWVKLPGDYVKEGETICTIEGDKAILDVEAPVSGILKKIVAKKGTEFPVKEVMAYIGDPGDVIDVEPEPEPKTAAAEADKGSAPVQSTSSSKGGRVNASPVAKRLAQEKNINLSKVKGSGPDGRISKEDLLAYFAEEAPQSGVSSSIGKQLTGIKKTVAERMAQSNREIPHFHLSISCDISEANKLRKEFNNKKGSGSHISLTDVVSWSVSRQLQKHPVLNSSFTDNQVIEHRDVNIGLAVDTPNGLLVVVIKDAVSKSLEELAGERQVLTQRALESKQTVEDISGATFSITNLGMFGILTFDPIISPGQVAILSLGELKNAFELDENNAVKPFEQISMTLGCDHRAVDGVAGAKFLADLKESLSQPSGMYD